MEHEQARTPKERKPLLTHYKSGRIEAGCDEAGRGCLAGPVYAAAVILPADFDHPLLNDSKQMTEQDRNILRPIIEKESIAWAVASVSAEEIDKMNILNASILAMHKAIDDLKRRPKFLLIDGNQFKKYKLLKHANVVKGDSIYMNIAAASVLAKTHRDEYMTKIAVDFPQYGWQTNKGYPTEEHRDALKIHGVCPHHRRSYRLWQVPAAAVPAPPSEES
jgi:ribonuclease HII